MTHENLILKGKLSSTILRSVHDSNIPKSHLNSFLMMP